MHTKSLLVLPLLLSASMVRADVCHNKAPRRVTAPTAGVSRVVVVGRAGSLHVVGHAGGGDLVASGTACSSDKDYLDEIQLTAQRSGSTLRIEAVLPGQILSFGSLDSRLDFEVSLPSSIPVDVEDGSGATVIENTGPLDVHDGSGELTIRQVNGSASVEDGSGELTVNGVGGDLKIDDGSGEIVVDGVRGSVTVTDGSGSMTLRHVDHNVVVENDGSGSIDVSDVRGDFTVEHDGSGGVHYERVGGKVRIPRD